MCDPITIGLLAAGTVASFAGNQIATSEANDNAAAIASARNKVLEDTLRKNQAYADQSREVFNKRVNDIGANAATDIAASQAKHTADIQANIPTAAPPGEISLAGSAPTVVQSSLAKKLSDIFNESSDKGKRLGSLTGYGGFFQDQGIKDQTAGRDVGVNADSIAGNMRLMPSLQDFAEIQASKPSSGLGQILSALGGMAASAAGARGMGAAAPADAGGFLRPNLALKNKFTGTLGGGV